MGRLPKAGSRFFGLIEPVQERRPRSTPTVDHAVASVSLAIELASEAKGGIERVKAKIRLLCIEAKRTDTPVDVLIVKLRQAIDERGSLSRIHVAAREPLRQAIVSWVIATYYGGR